MLHIQFHDVVAEIRMDRPPANALNRELVEQLLAGLETARMDGARAIVLTGRPGMFSGGLDVPELLALPADAGLPAYLEWVRRECGVGGEG